VGHAHAHEAAGHSHGVSADADRGKLAIALALIVGFMGFEVVVGIVAHSLALLSDAAHMLTDAGAIGLSLLAIRLAAKPAKGAMTYGLKRTEILSAQFNGATLLVLGLLIIYEGIRRLITPPDVAGGAVLVVALVGVAVNLAATYTLSKPTASR
jgi:cobalt-zinc-cadmium efflux system protein